MTSESWVSEREAEYIRRTYADQAILNDEIASDLDMNEAEFLEACVVIGLEPRRNPPIYVPSPSDILLASAEIRGNWTQADREERLRAAWPELDKLKEDSR